MCPVIGVGASAGGLEAFTQLLSALPKAAPLAMILVQHLDPHHESTLTDLLAKTLTMPIVTAEHGMCVESACVYVIPENVSMRIEGGVLILAPRASAPDPHRIIDHFLRSLADDCGSRAVGVILSGNASDGTLGLAAIKAAGGFTLAQDPESAAFGGMPRSAIASGSVDLVLPPQGIALELVRLASHPYIREAEAASSEQTPREDKSLETILGRLHRDTGVDFTQYRQSTVRRRVARRMLVHNLDTLDDYRRYMDDNAAEVSALHHDLLITVTRFFRDPGVFRALARRIFPKIIKRRKKDAPIRVWVPGCATGEEVYSVAMALLEALGDSAGRVPIQIFGSDASAAAIERARLGTYPDSIELDVSRERLRKYFVKSEGHYQVRKSLRELCIFAAHNVARDPPFSSMDLVSCRNMLIYFEAQLQKRVMAVLHYALKNEGYLILGNSETVGPLANLFSVADRKYKVYCKKATSSRPDLSFTGFSRGIGSPRNQEVEPEAASKLPHEDIGGVVDRIVLGKYAPAGVVINEGMDILLFRGRTGPYLEPSAGQASLNILRMAREGVLKGLREALAEVRRTGSAARREGLFVEQDGKPLGLSLEILPVHGRGGERNFLVLFESVSAAARHNKSKSVAKLAAPAPGRKGNAEVERLHEELAGTREFLQSLLEERECANEELRSTNEEILSSNEELQSTNEELETAKEELQSTNEELTTLNEELRHRNAELSLLSDDLNNLLAGVNLPVLVVGGDLRIRRFTPLAAELFNLLPADIGQHLRNLKTNLEGVNPEDLCARVVDAAIPSEQEVKSRHGRWYSLRVRPYRTGDNRIDGAVIVGLDITSLKEGLSRATSALDYAESVVDTVGEPLVVLDGSLCVKSANRAFYRMFAITPERAIGWSFFELGHQLWDVGALRTALRSVIENHAVIEEFEAEFEFAGVGRRIMLLNAREVSPEPPEDPMILLAMVDVTLHREITRQREALLAEAESANRSKDDFIAMLSHELRAPLAAVMGWTHLITSGKLTPEEVTKALRVIDRNTRLQARLIEDLLDISRISAGSIQMEPVSVDLDLLVNSAIDAVSLAAEETKTRIIVSIGAAVPKILGDRDRLDQVVRNLLSNSIKFAPGGTVRIEVRQVDTNVRITVQDDGAGIRAEALPRVFEPFFQGHAGRGKLGGLGLGLALVRHIVDLHGGSVEARSAGEGKGTLIQVDLPSENAAGPAGGGSNDLKRPGSRAVSPDGAHRLQGLRVLVVDDDEDLRSLISRAMADSGADVTAVESAEAALAVIGVQRPDILLSDIRLPGEDGYALLRKVRALPADRCGMVPAVALTAYATAADRKKAFDAGYQGHVSKPVDPEDLIALLAEVAGRARAAK